MVSNFKIQISSQIYIMNKKNQTSQLVIGRNERLEKKKKKKKKKKKNLSGTVCLPERLILHIIIYNINLL